MLNLVITYEWVVYAMHQLLYPRKEPWYPLYRRLGGPQGQCGQI